MVGRRRRQDDGREIWRADTVRHAAVPLIFAVDRRDALVYIGLGAHPGGLLAHARRHGATVRVETRPHGRVWQQLVEYLRGQRRRFELDVRLLGSEFQRAAWEALCAIPFGETRTYAQQAEAIDRPGAARAIGHANGQNPIPIVVPCHRVLGHDGSLTGFGGGLPLKRWLLELESPQRSLALWGDASPTATA